MNKASRIRKAFKLGVNPNSYFQYQERFSRSTYTPCDVNAQDSQYQGYRFTGISYQDDIVLRVYEMIAEEKYAYLNFFVNPVDRAFSRLCRNEDRFAQEE